MLIADIERGGVFAHLLGTLDILSKSERNRIFGLVINRFRGDLDILQPGIEWLQQKCQKPMLGVIPFLHDLHIDAEDSLNIVKSTMSSSSDSFKIIIPKLPKISNHTDFDALRLHPQIELQYISENDVIPAADLIILPGSKSVQSDLEWLIKNGWKPVIQKHCRYGGKLIGICGGFQMLGSEIQDPDAIEGTTGTSAGLKILDMITILQKNKTLQNRTGKLAINNVDVSGYEIHSGISSGSALDNPAILFSDSTDGVLTLDGIILGTYLHGLFDSESAITAILQWAGLDKPVESNYQLKCEDGINKLADVIEKCVDLDLVYGALNIEKTFTPTLSQRERE